MDKIFEVTGITDSSQINKAIKAVQDDKGSYEIGDVIQFLVTDPQPNTELSQVRIAHMTVIIICSMFVLSIGIFYL